MFDEGLRGGQITIESNVYIGMKTLFCAVSHEIGEPSFRAGKAYAKDIFVGEGTWIGANVTILPNVKIGKGCIIAAGAVVNKDCEENCLYAGVPAKLIKRL